MDRSPRQQTSLSPRSPSLAWDKSHCQQTPLSPRSPSSAWTGLIASRLLSPHARPPPHGTCLITSRLPSPHTDRSHRQVSPKSDDPTADFASLIIVVAFGGDVRRTEGVSSPAWTGLIVSRLPRVASPKGALPTLALPRMGQVSPPADSPLAQRPDMSPRKSDHRDACPRNGLV